MWSKVVCCVFLAGVALAGCAEEECPSGDEMVELVAPALGYDFQMDRYEASRFDASASSMGSGSEIACSIPNVIPWTKVTYSKAKSACAAAGKHLCTRNEWQAACVSLGAGRQYPYGNNVDYEDGICNGANTSSSTEPTGSHSGCLTLHGIFDLSGNAREWVTASDGLPAGLAGGGFTSSEFELDCSSIIATDNPKSHTVGTGDGFRCCK